MPEGDTIWRAARALEKALVGRSVRRLSSRLGAIPAAADRLAIVGRRVERVEARGKHVLLVFGGSSGPGPVLHLHLGMHGRFWIDSGQGPSRLAQLSIDCDGVVASCTRASVVELLSAQGVRSHPVLARLGPDVLAEDFDARRARARLRSRGELEVAVALLDQTALAGIGNVYKSELLFVCGVSPRARVGELDDPTLERLVAAARRLMTRNLGPGPRRTTGAFSPERLFVYGRSGRPCRRCGTPVQRLVQGEQARSTYFCPRCQPAPAR